MSGLDVPRLLPGGLPDRVTEAFQASELKGRSAAMAALHLGPVKQQMDLQLVLAQSYLREMNPIAAREHLVACDALCRTQRLARARRLEVALNFSLLSRLEGRFQDALWYAGVVKRARKLEDHLLGAAFLASATAQRLSGQPIKSATDLEAAKDLMPGPEIQAAELLTWLQTDPKSVMSEATIAASRLPAPFQARLAWMLADQAIREHRLDDAAAWCTVAEQEPTAREELRFAPLAAFRARHQPVLPRTDKPPVHVETIRQQGLWYLDQFMPVPGNGTLLAVLAYLISRGQVEASHLATDVLEPEPTGKAGVQVRLPGGRRGGRTVDQLSPKEIERRLDVQVRRHLSTLRQFLGDSTCVVTEEGVIFLDARQWTCDALVPGARTPVGRPWLPRVPGSWVVEQRRELASHEHDDDP